MTVERIFPASAPKPIGPYAPMVQAGPYIFGSAIAAFDPETGDLVGTTAYEQAKQVLHLIRTMLGNRGYGPEHLAQITVYMKNIADFDEMNRAFVEVLGENLTARTVVEVSNLPKPEALLTMSFIAMGQWATSF
ncbi:MAG: RidA family protein [Armatimonadetes bacterium]|nr:RidA family protein [Armatimonadota bacterium]